MEHLRLMSQKLMCKIEMYNVPWLNQYTLVLKLKTCGFLTLLLAVYSQDSLAQQNSSSSKLIGVWEVKGDSMIIWQAYEESILTIKFIYLPPSSKQRFPKPKVQFALIDSSITSKEYESFDIFNTEHRFLIPSDFDLISTKSRSTSFSFSLENITFKSTHELNCESDSTIDQLTYELYTGNYTKQKFIYTFNTEGLGDAIRQIACK